MKTHTTATAQPTDAAAMEAHRDSLYRQLEEGYDRIGQALADGDLETDWTGFWQDLLADYERVVDELQRELAA